MGYWNYRIIKKTDKETDSRFYRIHEVFYSDDHSIESWTEGPVNPFGESLAGLREDVNYFLSAFRKPVLVEKEINGTVKLIDEEDDFEINSGHYSELLDRAYVAMEHVNQFLGAHPVVRKDERLRRVYERVEDDLGEFYQSVGRMIDGK